jgi:hypothetical protein
MAGLGRVVLVLGLVLVVIGAALTVLGRFALPGDLTFRWGGVTIYVPLAASVILSILVTVAVNIALRHR